MNQTLKNTISYFSKKPSWYKILVSLYLIISVFGLEGCQIAEKERSEIGVGFKNGVSQKEAEDILSKYKLEFEKRDNLNMGKVFFYETGERYLIRVPKGTEKEWIDKLNKEEKIRKVGIHRDRSTGFFID